MAYKKTNENNVVTLKAKDYFTLLKDHLMMTALRELKVEQDDRYKAVNNLLKSGHIEIKIKPVFSKESDKT